MTIVLSRHYLEEAEQVCDQLAIVDHGRLVVHGPPQNLVEDLGAHLVELRGSGVPGQGRPSSFRDGTQLEARA